MSSEQPSNSIYDSDSIPDISESPDSDSVIEKDVSQFYSSGSSIELSGIQSSAEIGNSIGEVSQSSSEKLESIKSLWSTDDISWDKKDISHDDSEKQESHHHKHILPNIVSPFVDSNGIIRYNFERGVDYNTPLLIGSRKATGRQGESGYHPSHLIFDPKTGTLASGYDVNNGWARLPNFSLITGLGNTAQLDASFVSGAHNHLKLQLLPATRHNKVVSTAESSIQGVKNDEYCLIPPSCAIVGGNNNTITNSTACQHSSAIIASSGINVEDCEETVVIGMRSAPGQQPFRGYKESVFARNIYGLGLVHAGPLRSDPQPQDGVLDVNGSAWIEDSLRVGNYIDSDSATFNNVVATNGTFQSLSVSNINNNSYYIEGNSSGTTGITGITGITGTVVEFTMLPGDGINIIYANPVNGDIYINLGTNANNIFENNRLITIKDVTLEFARTSSNNVYIWVPTNVRIENYANGTGGYSLTASVGGAYMLNTNGGSVTLRYFESGVPGSLPTWVIENQFIGNARLNPTSGFTFVPASENARRRLIRHN